MSSTILEANYVYMNFIRYILSVILTWEKCERKEKDMAYPAPVLHIDIFFKIVKII